LQVWQAGALFDMMLRDNPGASGSGNGDKTPPPPTAEVGWESLLRLITNSVYLEA